VFGFIDDPHAAAAKLFEDAVVRDGPPNERVRGRHSPAILGCDLRQVNESAGFCSCNVRMSGLCKVEMSAFLGAGGPDGRGADRVERERAGAIEGFARSRARASAADRSGPPFAAERSAGAAVAGASWQGGRSRAGTRAA